MQPQEQELAESRCDTYCRQLLQELSAWCEARVVQRALRIAGEPTLVLDIPCENGRFWRVLTRHPNRLVLAADGAPGRIAGQIAVQGVTVAERICNLHAANFHIELGENSVDNIFCMRFLHQIESADRRLAILREFQRVTRDTAIISLCVDGNYQAWRYKRRIRRQAFTSSAMLRLCGMILPRKQVEEEFRISGFQILAHMDELPGYSMYRTYILRKESPSA